MSAGIGAGFAAAGFAWRCGAALGLAIGFFFMPQHPAFFAIGGMAAGILSSCIGMPAMPGIASCFSIMPPAGIDASAGGAGWVEVWPAACPWAEAIAGDGPTGEVTTEEAADALADAAADAARACTQTSRAPQETSARARPGPHRPCEGVFARSGRVWSQGPNLIRLLPPR